MKKMFLLFFAVTIFLLSCNEKPFDNTTPEYSTQPFIDNQNPPDSQSEDDINPIVETLFSSKAENISFDDIIKDISGGDMTFDLVYESREPAKIAREENIYYAINPNLYNINIRISPLDTFIGILEDCEYIETAPLDEPLVYTFVFYALDINGEKNEICVYVTRSCVRFAYNGLSDDKEYINICKNYYKNVCDGYDRYIKGIIPDENNQLATIW